MKSTTHPRARWPLSPESHDELRRRLQEIHDKPGTPTRLRKSTLKLLEQMTKQADDQTMGADR